MKKVLLSIFGVIISMFLILFLPDHLLSQSNVAVIKVLLPQDGKLFLVKNKYEKRHNWPLSWFEKRRYSFHLAKKITFYAEANQTQPLFATFEIGLESENDPRYINYLLCFTEKKGDPIILKEFGTAKYELTKRENEACWTPLGFTFYTGSCEVFHLFAEKIYVGEIENESELILFPSDLKRIKFRKLKTPVKFCDQ